MPSIAFNRLAFRYGGGRWIYRRAVRMLKTGGPFMLVKFMSTPEYTYGFLLSLWGRSAINQTLFFFPSFPPMSGTEEDNFLTGGDRGTCTNIYIYNSALAVRRRDIVNVSVIELSPIARHKQIIFLYSYILLYYIQYSYYYPSLIKSN